MHREVLIESKSPLCPARACVEQTAETVCFYLYFPLKQRPDDVRFVWICNRKPAPEHIGEESRFGSDPPMMPLSGLTHPVGGMELDAQKLRIVWFETGDGAALLEGKELIAVVPPWSGPKGFHGYSRFARGKQLLAWEMDEEAERNLYKRTMKGYFLWQSHADGSYFDKLLQYCTEKYDAFFDAPHTGCYPADDGEFPPRTVVEGRRRRAVYGITAGMRRFVMPGTEMHIRDFQKHCRTEFGFACEDACSDVKAQAYACLAAVTKAVFRDMTYFAHGNTKTWEGIPGFYAILFLNAREAKLGCPDMGVGYGDFCPINLLWAVPVTKVEYLFTVENGVESLMMRAEFPETVHIFDGKPKFYV